MNRYMIIKTYRPGTRIRYRLFSDQDFKDKGTIVEVYEASLGSGIYLVEIKPDFGALNRYRTIRNVMVIKDE